MGNVTFVGDPVPPRKIKVTKDVPHCDKAGGDFQEVHVGENGGLANVVVEVKGVPDDQWEWPETDEKYELRQNGCQFPPWLMVVPNGQQVTVFNDDEVTHNVNTLANRFRELTADSPHQINSNHKEDVVATLKRRVDDGGMVVVHQDIYLRSPIGAEFADFVLPAATWGEADFSRCNGERRLRLYSKFCDPPGEAKPDWWIISRFAQRMGFRDYDWKDANDVFEQAARFGRKGMLNYQPLVHYAKKCGIRGHDLLRQLGTDGIQTPVRYREQLTEDDAYLAYAGSYQAPDVDGAIVGTKRLHAPEADLGIPEGPTFHPKWLSTFNSHSGKALLHKTPWNLFEDFYDRIRPRGDELWLTCGRINEIWQTMFDDVRRPYIMQRWPEQWIEIHPDDARRRSIETGDYVLVVNDDVLIQTGGFIAVDQDDHLFAALEKAGHIRIGRGEMKAVAIVTEDVRPGVLWTNALIPGSPANSLVHRVPDPITNRYRFKLGKGIITKTGVSPYKQDLTRMSFARRSAVV